MQLRRYASVILLLASSQAWAISPGEPGPGFDLAAVKTDASRVNAAMYRGQVVLVDLWASWCPPCRTSMPLLDEVYRKFRDQGFRIAALSQDPGLEDARRFMQKVAVS